ncbi:spindle pole body component alp6 [Pseudovirgaria hyperparasitica]|uniref:Spindle pole body component alp6 n=1 Tax=Pseudovirgaria hyperparasitica TaxID=470096 RepID=A0A6A6VTW2_9PEZI|nr:spindle pole body component alp6 [Pseudovirgaria hyperparasitica]KAF2753329.1 spindle pole body component alp6 [Pseudovirgaria hyperparasitica]
MSKSREERIEHALSPLVEKFIPSAGKPNIVTNVDHVSGLIKSKLLLENGEKPYAALKFSNLFSRLKDQPVLNEKWAMLYFLYKLSETQSPNRHQNTGAHARPTTSGSIGLDHSKSLRSQDNTRELRQEGFIVDAPAFNEAFSKTGLLKLPREEEIKLTRPGSSTGLTSSRGPERPVKIKEREKKSEKTPREETAFNTRVSGVLEPSETALLRDLPFTLQGLSSTHLAFKTSTVLKLPPRLPVPLISLLHTLAEPSLLYRGLSEFVESSEGGLIGQSFRSALGRELRSYLGLVATLEGQIRKALATIDDLQPQNTVGKAGVTLKKCVIWTREATLGLRLMKLMVEQSKDRKGGQLISLIHSFSLTHGDPFVGTFAERLLSHVTRPFYDMLRQWIYDGELADPYFEFFVSEHSEDGDSEIHGDSKRGGATSVWQDKYKLGARMIPSIITEEFANKVFLIGKTLNFIRYGCGDAAWVESYSKDASKELRYGDTANLERSIGEAYKTTMARLIHLMEDKFALFEHLKALKKYLLLGAGDFIAILMESLAANLDRPANTQYRHTLTAQLEHAVRNSNAQYDSADVLRRLDARMLELSHGEIGWDVFTLEYKIDAPVDVIVTPFGNKQYLKVFNFLWRVKRVEFALGSTWRRCMTGARGILGAVSDKLGADWKIARGSVAEMIHFVNQLQYYILFEVIEASWNELQMALHKPEATLDDMIKAHDVYLNSITRKGLLGSSGGYDFTSQLHELLKTMLHYKEAVDGLYSFSVAEFTRRQERSAKIETRTAAGKWGITERDEFGDLTPATASAKLREDRKKPRETDSPYLFATALTGSASEDDVLDGLRKRLKLLNSDFKVKVNILLGDLYAQPDADMRWLAMVMNFNDTYTPAKRKRRTRPGDDKRRDLQTPATVKPETNLRSVQEQVRQRGTERPKS